MTLAYSAGSGRDPTPPERSVNEAAAQRFLSGIQPVAQTTDLDSLLPALVACAVEILGVARSMLWVWDAEHRHYRLAATNPEDQPLAVGTTFTPEDFPAVRVGYRSFGPVLVEDTSTSDLVPRFFAEAMNVRSVLAAPIVSVRVPLGFITFDDPGTLRVFTSEDVQLAAGIAAVAGSKLGHFETERILSQALGREKLLREVTRDLHDAPFALRERLMRLAERACEAIGADHAALYVTASDGEHIADVLTVNVPPAVQRLLNRLIRTSIDTYPLGRSLMEGRTVVVNDVAATPGNEEAAAMGVRAYIAVPLHARPVRMGALTLAYSSGPHAFSDEEISIAEDLGRVGGLAVHSTYLYEAALEREGLRTQMLRRVTEAQELERRLLSTELLDTVQQRQLLSSSLLELATIALEQGDVMNGGKRLREAMVELAGAQRSIKQVVGSLQAPEIELAGLMPALRDLVRPLAQLGVRAAVDGTVPDDLDPAIGITVFRAVQEAISNVRRHAQASFVEVRLKTADGNLVVEVADDGVGFDTRPISELVRKGHFGLAAIHDRVVFADGTMRLSSRPGLGTELRLEIPLRIKMAGTKRTTP